MEQTKPEEVATPAPEAAPAAPSAPAAKPGPTKKTWLIVAVVAVVAVVVIAAVVLGTGMLNSDDSGDDGDDINDGGATTWLQKSGDFVEYTMTGSGYPSSVTMRIEVKEVTSTNMTINTSMSMGGNSLGSSEQIVPLNDSIGSPYDLDQMPSYTTLSDKGMQTISTKWGSISAHHYVITDDSTPKTITQDVWIKDGIVLKMEQNVEGQSDKGTVTLTDTNIKAITG